MKLLLDTHVLLWWVTASPKLSGSALEAIGDGKNEAFWSAASSWEVGIKYALGRLPLPASPFDFLARQLEINGIQSLAINDAHAFSAASLPPLHADPFDRMLVAQAQAEGLVLVTADRAIRRYEVAAIW